MSDFSHDRSKNYPVVWITGGGSGIGRALAREYIARGATVIVSGRRRQKLEETLAGINGDHLALPCDVANEEQTRNAFETIIKKYGTLDTFVANAGFGVSGMFENLTIEDFRRQFDVNYFAVVKMIQDVLPEIRKSKGRIAIIGSVMSHFTLPASSAYASSKYAVRAFGQTLAMELAGSGASITLVHPGFVKTDIGKVDNSGSYKETNESRMPKFGWSPEKAAKATYRAIQKRKREHVFSLHGKFVAKLGRYFPGFVHFVMSRVAKTERFRKLRDRG